VAKTPAQIEKQKREAEKRKKRDKAILKIAREMPDDPAEEVVTPPIPGNGVKCLRCEGTGHLILDCDICKGQGKMVVRCRKCAGKGTYTQLAGPCSRCAATGVLEDGTQCPRCKGRKLQLEFSSPCFKCSGTGTTKVACKRCGGSLRYKSPCGNCGGTGIYQPKP